MYLSKVRQVFQNHGYSPSSSIDRFKFNNILSNLMTNGEPYDEQVAKQLWDQASNGSPTIRVDDICQTIVDGINILQKKITEISDQLRLLERQRRQATDKSLTAKIDNEIYNLQQDKEQFEEDLRLVTIPFGIEVNGLSYRQSRVGAASGAYQSPMGSGLYDSPENQDLKYILYFTLAFCLIEIIIIYGKYDFLNVRLDQCKLLVLSCLLSIYLLNHFDGVFIKLTLAMLIISEVLDIIWLFMYADQKWNPPKVGNNSGYEQGYMRFIVIFTVVIIILKVPLGYWLFKYRDTNPDNKYVVSMGLLKIVLSANKTNPITRGITNSIAT